MKLLWSTDMNEGRLLFWKDKNFEIFAHRYVYNSSPLLATRCTNGTRFAE